MSLRVLQAIGPRPPNSSGPSASKYELKSGNGSEALTNSREKYAALNSVKRNPLSRARLSPFSKENLEGSIQTLSISQNFESHPAANSVTDSALNREAHRQTITDKAENRKALATDTNLDSSSPYHSRPYPSALKPGVADRSPSIPTLEVSHERGAYSLSRDHNRSESNTPTTSKLLLAPTPATQALLPENIKPSRREGMGNKTSTALRNHSFRDKLHHATSSTSDPPAQQDQQPPPSTPNQNSRHLKIRTSSAATPPSSFSTPSADIEPPEIQLQTNQTTPKTIANTLDAPSYLPPLNTSPFTSSLPASSITTLTPRPTNLLSRPLLSPPLLSPPPSSHSSITPFPLAPTIPITAPSLTPIHFACYQSHRRVLYSTNHHHPVPCMVCKSEDRGARWTCAWCCLRICKACMEGLDRVGGRDLRTLLYNVGVEESEDEELERSDSLEGTVRGSGDGERRKENGFEVRGGELERSRKTFSA